VVNAVYESSPAALGAAAPAVAYGSAQSFAAGMSGANSQHVQLSSMYSTIDDIGQPRQPTEGTA